MGYTKLENNWEDQATYFAFSADIRRLIYTNNTVESYNRQLRKVIKTKGGFPNCEAVRKLLFLATRDITKSGPCPSSTGARFSTN